MKLCNHLPVHAGCLLCNSLEEAEMRAELRKENRELHQQLLQVQKQLDRFVEQTIVKELRARIDNHEPIQEA